MNKPSKILLVAFLLLPVLAYSQMYSPKDIVNQYDPFVLTVNEVLLSTNDDEFKERNNFVVIMTVIIGNEKIVKFLKQDDFTINNVKSFNDDFWQCNMTVKKNNSMIIPAIYNLPNSTNSITIKFEGFSSLYPGDNATLEQLSTGFCYVSSSMYNFMELAYKFLAASPDVNRPNYSNLTTAEVLQQNIKTRPGIFYLGNPNEINYIIPQDPKKAFGTNLLVQGKKTLESTIRGNVKDNISLTVTKYTDVKLVQSEPYYLKVKGVFHDLASQTKIDYMRSESNLFKAQDIISSDLVIGLKAGVYMNDQVVRQLSSLMNLLKAGVRAKSDTVETTTDIMRSDEREALSFIETALRENDYNLETQYIYDDYINSSVNRGMLQKEIDIIRKYYLIK
jgi:hypothetical protein